jgi:hypothetical protein
VCAEEFSPRPVFFTVNKKENSIRFWKLEESFFGLAVDRWLTVGPTAKAYLASESK